MTIEWLLNDNRPQGTPNTDHRTLKPVWRHGVSSKAPMV